MACTNSFCPNIGSTAASAKKSANSQLNTFEAALPSTPSMSAKKVLSVFEQANATAHTAATCSTYTMSAGSQRSPPQ